ncbi:MAG: FAD-dependent oxidoreductase, partial [Clostridia bacterium]|nr:FAD-dependent oxidoreductase [Clostridia bacterium]
MSCKIHEHRADVCVIGGGFAGMCAAIAAARHGAKVAIVHDRPMFGGNASSEV